MKEGDNLKFDGGQLVTVETGLLILRRCTQRTLKLLFKKRFKKAELLKQLTELGFGQSSEIY